jgi:aminopeptidase
VNADQTELARRYADLVVRVGANVRAGQHVFVTCAVEHASVARAVTASAYAAGACYVDVHFRDDFVRRSFVEAANDDMLTYTPPWLLDKLEWMHELRAAEILLVGDTNPGVFDGLDERRLSRSQPLELVRRLMEVRLRQRSVNWTIVAAPNEVWAEQVFGTRDLGALWEAVARAVRLDEPDPVASWQQHLARLRDRADALNRAGFDSLHFHGPGTDLTVGLLDVSRWVTGDSETTDAWTFCNNLPTEEIFTTPDPARTEGVVRATRPFIPRPGLVVEGLSLLFAAGKIVEVRATRGEGIVMGHLATDAGAAFLGEVALVDGDSRVGRLKRTFYNTLMDENAACHIAYGASFPKATNFRPGGNESTVHADLMIGGPNIDVDGLDRTGRATPLLRDDVWVFGEA